MKKAWKYVIGIAAGLTIVAITALGAFAACPESGCASKAGYYFAMQQAAVAQPATNPIVMILVIAGIAYAAKWLVDKYYKK